MNEKDEFSSHFRANQVKFSRFYARILTQAGLTLPQYALLNQLAVAGIMSMTEVSEKLYVTKPAVTHLVDCLEKNKFLKRIPHSSDRRVFLLEIQPKGEKISSKIQSDILRFLLKTLNKFNADERKTITRFYAELSQTMENALMRSKGSAE